MIKKLVHALEQHDTVIVADAGIKNGRILRDNERVVQVTPPHVARNFLGLRPLPVKFLPMHFRYWMWEIPTNIGLLLQTSAMQSV